MKERDRGRGKEKGSEKAVKGERKRTLSENAGKGDPWGPSVGLAPAAALSMVDRFMTDMISVAASLLAWGQHPRERHSQ